MLPGVHGWTTTPNGIGLVTLGSSEHAIGDLLRGWGHAPGACTSCTISFTGGWRIGFSDARAIRIENDSPEQVITQLTPELLDIELERPAAPAAQMDNPYLRERPRAHSPLTQGHDRRDLRPAGLRQARGRQTRIRVRLSRMERKDPVALRVCAIVVACTALVAVFAGGSAVRVFALARRSEASAVTTRATSLGDFVAVRTPGGVNPTLQVRAVATGSLVKDLGSVGASWTNNGFAFSPDGTSVYMTLIGHRTLKIERVDIATGVRSIVADGEQPAISFDGRELAFAAGGTASTAVAVRDLASGRERRIDLGSLLGRAYELLNSSIAWTRDGSAIVVLASHIAIADAGADRSATIDATPPTRPSCTTQPATACLIEIHATPGRRLRAARIPIAIPTRGVLSVAGDGARPRAVLLVTVLGFGSALNRITLGGRTPRTTRIVSLAKALFVAVDPRGSRILYVIEGMNPALWRAQISGGRLTQRRKLIPNVSLEAASW